MKQIICGLIFLLLYGGIHAQATLFGNGSAGDLTIHAGQVDSTFNSYYSVIAVHHDTITLDSPLPLAGNQTVLVFFAARDGGYPFTGLANLQYSYSATNSYKVSNYPWQLIVPDSLAIIQMLLVPQYRKLVIDSGGIVTCPAWNDSTGGYLVFQVKDTFIIKGQINLTGKGFCVPDSLTFGLGGSGGLGGAGGITGNNGGVYGSLFLTGVGGGGNGGIEGYAGQVNSYANQWICPSYYLSAVHFNSLSDFFLVPGCPGSYGYSLGGYGGGGGGGGAGAVNCNSGTAGGTGGNGGYGGRAGTGGGSCLFTVNSVISNTGTHFISNGTNGGNGTNGEDGGPGGNGGNGCGTCASGGPGGGGCGAGGGNGGGGGYGGGGGSFMYITAYNLSPPFGNSAFTLTGGNGGQGGLGGHGGLAGINGISIIDSACATPALHDTSQGTSGGNNCFCDYQSIIDTLTSMGPAHNNDGHFFTDSLGVLHFVNTYNDVTITHGSNYTSYLDLNPISPNTNCYYGIIGNYYSISNWTDSLFKLCFLDSFHIVNQSTGSELKHNSIPYLGCFITCQRQEPQNGRDGVAGGGGGSGDNGSVFPFNDYCNNQVGPFTQTAAFYNNCGELTYRETTVYYDDHDTSFVQYFSAYTGGGAYTSYYSETNGFGCILNSSSDAGGYDDMQMGSNCISNGAECAPAVVMPLRFCDNAEVSFTYTGCAYSISEWNAVIQNLFTGDTITNFDLNYLSPHVFTITNLPALYLDITITDPYTHQVFYFSVYTNVDSFQVDVQEIHAISCNGGDDGSLRAYAYPSGTYTYVWNNPPSNTNTANNLSAGTYSVYVYDASGCYFRTDATITEPSPLQLNITPSATLICSSDSIQICATSGFNNYTWSNGASNTCIYTNIAGTYQVEVTDANGCTAQSSGVTLNVNPAPLVSLNASQTIFCANDTAVICAIASSVSYQWNTGEVSSCVTAYHAGNFWVTVTDANNCTAVSNHLAVNIYPIPPVSISVNGNVLTAYSATAYQWYFNDTLISGANASIYTAQQSGNYTVEITDSNGCQTVSNPVAVVVTGISSNTAIDEQLQIYPNPATTQLFIQANRVEIDQVNIYNTTGSLVMAAVSLINNQLSIINLPQGVYIAEIKTKEGAVRRRWVKM